MIFALAQKGAALFVFLSEQDVATLRTGHTLFVDQRQLKGATFEQIVLALGKTDAENVKLLGKGAEVYAAQNAPQPHAHQSVCKGCQGLIDTETLFEEKCIVCWAAEAKKARIARN